MKGEYKGLTSLVRETAKKFGRDFTSDELKDEIVNVRTYRGRKAIISGVINDLRTAGEIKNVRRGVYCYVPKQKAITRLDVIWHLVRSHRSFHIRDIERLSGAASSWVHDYLYALRKEGFLRRNTLGQWQLIKDPGPERPKNRLRKPFGTPKWTNKEGDGKWGQS